MEKLKLIKDLPNNKVEVEDLQGLRWIVGKATYKRFKRTGFLTVAKSVAKEFQSILNGRNFGELSDHEKYEVLISIIESATREPIAVNLPNLSQIKG